MFQFPASPFRMLWIHIRIHEVRSCRLPHSEISGSMAICASPKLFAAYHVFHRLPVPRHSPCALTCLTSPKKFDNFLRWNCSSDTTFLLLFKSAASFDVFDSFFSVQFSRYNTHGTPCEWRMRDSNSRPPACKAGALPTELIPHRCY